MLVAAILVIFPLCMAIAASSDLITMTIPNRVSVILLAGFFVVAPLCGMPLEQIGFHLLAGVAVFAAVFALFALNVMGGGDAKVLAASAVWFGWNETLVLYLGTVAFVGGFLTFLIVMLRVNENSIHATGLGHYIPKPILHAKKIPYGIAIGIGAFVTYPMSPLMQLVLSR
ncbi:prepilin peptidase [Rhizobium sp. L1K21]|uniref:A24 family peptidase n=1 Tax=Rhizobium sp. L1K21 TaxID=2954933 RepID=UPI00209379E2|nr:prepilin peptidase [Rhizobium sp. L1K21]MCO6187269.1 prepilin peptidase [Rhizobium sp. L1K21]